ncbi:arginase family protein, partial [Xanthomonas oryzae]
MARPMPCCAAARHGAGVPLECSVLSILEQCMATQYVPVSLIGVPTDIGAGHRGARMGPEALRIAGLHEA